VVWLCVDPWVGSLDREINPAQTEVSKAFAEVLTPRLPAWFAACVLLLLCAGTFLALKTRVQRPACDLSSNGNYLGGFRLWAKDRVFGEVCCGIDSAGGVFWGNVGSETRGPRVSGH
jgi:hypothetical protein